MCAAAKRRTESFSTATATVDQVVTRSAIRALRMMLQAAKRAVAADAETRQFAVELRDFHAAGVLSADLRWLVSQQHAEHLVESVPPGAADRRFRRARNLAFGQDSCFALTETGAQLAQEYAAPRRAEAEQPDAPTQAPGIPHWDGASRELWLGDVLVKRFTVPARNQERVLAAFEEEGWPKHIDDPLPQHVELPSKRRLHDTIVQLNRRQRHALIHFRGDGTGEGVCWELRSEILNLHPIST